jgi:hypothetical protein
MKYTLPTLFISLNMLNILDKTISWFALKNPEISELNYLVRFVVGKFGLTATMILWSLVGFVVFYIAYKIVTMKRLECKKHNMPPETIFMMLNVIFFLIVVNNLFLVFYKA